MAGKRNINRLRKALRKNSNNVKKGANQVRKAAQGAATRTAVKRAASEASQVGQNVGRRYGATGGSRNRSGSQNNNGVRNSRLRSNQQRNQQRKERTTTKAVMERYNRSAANKAQFRKELRENGNRNFLSDAQKKTLRNNKKDYDKGLGRFTEDFTKGVVKRYGGSLVTAAPDMAKDAVKGMAIGSLNPFGLIMPDLTETALNVGAEMVGKEEWSPKGIQEKMAKAGAKLQKSGQTDIEAAKEGKSAAAQWGIDLAAAASELGLDALLTRGRGTLGMAYARGYGSSKQSALEEGASEEQAKLYGRAMGALEAATEKVGSVAKPLRALYGKGAADDVIESLIGKITAKATSRAGKNAAYHGGKTLAAAITEGLEEMVSEGLEPTIANAIYAETVGTPHSTSAKDVLYAGSVGGALGGILGGGGQVMEYSQGKRVENIYGEDGIKDLAKAAKEVDEAGDAAKGAAINELVDQGEGIAAGQARELYNAVYNQEIKDLERANLVNRSADAIMQRENLISPIQVNQETGEVSLGSMTSQAFDEQKAAAQGVIDELATETDFQMPEMTVDQITSAVASIQTGLAGIDEVNLFTTGNPEARKIYKRVTGKELPDTNKATREMLFKEIGKNRVNSARLETKNVVDEIKGLITQDAAMQYEPAGQEAFAQAFSDVNVGSVADVADTLETFDDFYRAGRNGIAYADVISVANPVHANVTEEVRRAAWQAGQQDMVYAANIATEQQVRVDEAARRNGSRGLKMSRRGRFISEISAENRASVTASQQAAFRTLARVFGIDIHLVDSLESGANGEYHDGAIYLSMESDRALEYVFAHEITHHMQSYAPEAYSRLKELIRTRWAQRGDMEDAIKTKMAQYARRDVKISHEEALDEIIADSTYEVLQDEEFIDEVVKTDRSIAQAILDAIKNVLRKLRLVIAGGDRFTPAQNEALLSELDLLKEFERMWVDGLAKAAENRAAVGSQADVGVRRSLKNKNITANTRIPFVHHTSYVSVGKGDRKALASLQSRVKNIQRGIYENKASGYKADITSVTIKKILNPATKFNPWSGKYVNNLNAAIYLPELFENAVYLDTKSPQKAKNAGKQIQGYHHFIAPIYMDGKMYRVRIVAREKRNSDILYIVDTELLAIKNGAQASGQKPHTLLGSPSDISIPDLINGVNIYDYIKKKNDVYTSSDVKYSIPDTDTNGLVDNVDLSKYRAIGIRALAPDEHYNVGDELRESYDWDFENDVSTYNTGDPRGLGGTSAYDTQIDTQWDEKDEIVEKLNSAVKDSRTRYEGESVLVGGDLLEHGNDDREVVISNPTVIAKYNGDTETWQYSPAYSLPDTDSEGNSLTDAQREYFKDSKVVDSEGRLKEVYHGTNSAGFTVFNRTNNWYTDSKRVANSYTNNEGVYTGYLNITNPLVIDCGGANFSGINTESLPDGMMELFDEYGSSTFTEDGVNKTSSADVAAVVEEAIEEGVYDYDGVIFENVHDEGVFGNTEDDTAPSSVYVTFESNKFKNVDNENPTVDPDIRYSIPDTDSEGNNLTAEQRRYFADVSPLLKNDEGRLKIYHHGTARGDRVGNIFDPERATSGPMAYFTDSAEIAERYSKDKRDTSLEYDEEYDSYETQFRVEIDGESVPVQDLWYDMSPAEKSELIEKAKHIVANEDDGSPEIDMSRNSGLGNYDEFLLKEHRGNGIAALVDSWLNGGQLFGEEEAFLDVLKLAGVDDARYVDPDYREEKVYDVYLNVTNPLDTADVDSKFIDDLRDYVENTDMSIYDRESASADLWDKNDIDIDEWIEGLEDDIENGTTHSWTRIPDVVTDFLKDYMQVDGIVDTGGKNGGETHQVVIPFYSEQIKNVDNESPTGSPDIRYSLKDYDEKQINNWRNSKKIIIYESPQQLKDFVDEARQGKAGNKKIYFGVVPDDLAQRVLNDTGIDISNRNVALGAYEIQKIFKDHGDEDKEATRGQRAITADDFSNIRDVIESPDTIELDDELYNGRPVIKFTKVIGSKNTVVTYDSKKSFDLRVQTMYIGQNKKSLATAIDEQASINTPEATSGTAPKLSITDDGSKSNTQYSYPDEADVIEYANEHETEFVDVPPVRDYEKDAIRVKQQTYGELLEQVEKLKRDRKRTKGRVLDERSVREEVNDLISTLMTYSESYTLNGGRRRTNHKLVSEGVQATSKIFAALKKGDSFEAITTAELAAQDIVERLELVNDDMFYEYKDLRNYLKNTRIVVSEEDAANIPDFKEFKKQQAGRIRIVKQNGMPVDTVYQELVEQYPELFDAELTHPADQLLEIAEVRESLEPYDIMLSAEETQQLVKQTAQDLLDIAGRGKPYRSTVDKYDEKLRLVKARQQEAIRDVRRNERERAERLVQAEREKRVEQVNRAKERADERVQAEKDKAREKEAKRKDAQERREAMASIEQNRKWLQDRIAKPTDDKHVPEGMKSALADLLSQMDMQTQRSKNLEAKRGERAKRWVEMDELRSRLAEIAKEDGSGEFEYDGYIFEVIDSMAQHMDGRAIDEASTEQLHELDTLMKYIVANVRNYNKAFDESVKESISQLADESIGKAKYRQEKLKDDKYHDRSGVLGAADRLLNESMVSPRDFFERLGGGLEKAFMSMRRGMDRHVDNMAQTRDFFDKLFEPYRNKTAIRKRSKPGSAIEKWRDDSQVQTFTVQDGEITLSPAQIMSLYCLSKREQALGHIFGSGIVASKVDKSSRLKKALGGKISTSGSTVMVSMEDVARIVDTLTPEQKEMADKLQGYLNNECAAWGNEVSMRMYGYRKFTEENYFPIKSADAYLDSNFEGRQATERIKNFGFTKGTVVNANNPIMIDDIFSVVADHVNKMSLYNAFAAPISDFTRVYNYKSRDDAGLIQGSVKAAVEDAYGKKAINYINNFMSDVNSQVQTRSEGLTRFVSKSLANYKKSAIGGNLRVAVQQPTAVVRAFTLISPRYFVNAHINPVKNMRDMQEHCQIAKWKAWGFSQVDMARDIDDIMMNNEWSKIDTVTMEIYGALDNVTWSSIWAAVREETKAKHKDVKVDSEEFYQICNERASEIFDKTQVVDSVFHRSQAMRNTDVMSKMLTSFMAEPTRTFNMMRTEYARAIELWHEGNKTAAVGKFNRATSVFVLNAAAVSAAAAIADALRDKAPGDDDDDSWWANFWANFWGNVNPLNMIPMVKDIWGYTDGWGTQNMAMEGWEKLVQGVMDLAANRDAESLKAFCEGLGYVTGLPVKNVMREVDSIFKALGIEVFASEDGEEKKEKAGIFDSVLGKMNIKDGSNFDKVLNHFGFNLTEEEKAQREYDERLSDIKEKVEGLSGDEKQEKIWSEATENYTKYINNGDYKKLDEIRKLLGDLGGDVDKFDESVFSRTKTAYKKNIGAKGDPDKTEAYRYYLTKQGMTEGQISREVIADSDAADEFQLALCMNDEEAAIENLQALRDAGITYEDAYVLFVNRTKAIKGKDYSTGELSYPAEGEISSGFGWRSQPTAGASSYHEGIDIAAPMGSNVTAADGGKVSRAGWNGGKGYSVTIDHGNGRYTEYNHLNCYYIQKGDAVTKGQVIAAVGSTGVSTGPHLDFRVRESGTYVDPTVYFR